MPRMPSPIRTGRTSPIRPGSVSPTSFRSPTPTANDFPTPAGQVFTVRKRDQGLVSPAQSAFPFADDDSPIHAFSTPPTPPDSVDHQRAMTRPLNRGTPGEPGSWSSTAIGNAEQQTLRRKRSHQFYTEVFAYREPNCSPKDHVYKDSVVTCEVKTNVIVKEEYELLQDISHHLSLRYQRPITSICVTLVHSACMLFGGTFDSAYILTISALKGDLQPTTNKRNAALTQAFMADALGVAPVRGVVKFVGVPDEDLAFNGTTVLGQIENLQRAGESAKHSKASSVTELRTAPYGSPPTRSVPHPTQYLPSDPPSYLAPAPAPKPPPTLAPALSTLRKRESQKKRQYRFTPKKLPLRDGSQSVPLSRAASPSFDGRPGLSVPNYGSCHGAEVFDGRPMMPPVPVEKSASDQRAETMQRQGLGLGKRRSFWGVFSKKDIGRDGWIR